MTTYELDTLSSPRRATLTSTMSASLEASRTHVPRRQVPLLLVRQHVDVRADRGEFEPGDLAIDGFRHAVHVARQTRSLLYQILRGQRLVREAHVHHARRVSLGCSKVDEPPLAQQKNPLAAHHVFFDERPHVP